MNPDLRHFAQHLVGIVTLALWPVIITAFLSIPMSLNHHPGEAAPSPGLASTHMS